MRDPTRRRTRRRGDEEGSALVIALFFVVIFSLFVASVISFAEVGLKASASFDGKAKDLYATDGAVNAAINRFRRGGPCDDYTAPAGPDGQPLSGRGVIVRCVDDNRPAGGGATRPLNALLSLGPEGISTEPGFEQRVLGDIFSNSTVAAEATLIVQGEVSATGYCTGPIQTSPPVPLKCANNPNPAVRADVAEGRDPHYAKAIPTVPAYQATPACPPGKWLVTLKPGYYDDAGALSALTTGACPGRVIWLEPGNYYLDLTFRDPDSTWIINDPTVVVVAGTPRGWVPDPLGSLPAPSLSVPGSCKTAADPAPVGGGVQLVAGGGTHLQIDQGRVEVCAEPSKTDQSIALYGMAPDRPLVPTAWKDVSGFTAPGNATTIGENPVATATADLATGPASVTFTDFRPGIPEGSLIDSATLRVVHQDEGDMDDGSVKVAANFTGSSCAGLFPRPLPKRSGGLAEDRVDLKADCGLSTSNSAAFAGLTVTYSASLRAGGVTGTDILDGIAVDVAYRAPRTGKPTVVTASSGFFNPTAPPAPPAPPTNALEIESGQQPTALTADATLNSGAPTASITVAGLGDPPLPPSAVIDSAVLRVAHQEPDSVAPPKVTFSGSTCPPQALTVSSAAVTNEPTADLKACGLNTADKLKGLTATYDVALAAGGTDATAKLDGMWLELIYRLSHSPATVTPTVFTDPDNAKVIDGAATSNATLSPSGSTSASLVLADYSQPAVPADSIIDSAVLRVAHRDEGPMNPPTLVVAGIGPGPCPTALAKRPSTIGEDRIDLKACGLTAPSQLAGLSVTYTATLMAGATANATARVDGVVLDLSYRPPAVRRPATATTPAPGAASTAFTAPDNAKVIGESPTPPTADVTLLNGATAASVALAGYDGPVPLPAGSVIDSAVLRVAHQDQPGMGPVSLTAAFPPGPTAATKSCTGLPLSSQPTAIGVDRINLTECGLTTPEQVAGLTATYTANAPGTSTTTTHGAATATATGFTAPDNGKVIDGTTTDAALGTTNPSTVTLAGYDQAPPAAGSTTTSAVLRVAHRDDAGVGQLTATVLRSGVACMTQPLTPSVTLVAESFPIDLAACGLTDPSQLSGLTITYQASLDGTATAATASLDGAVLDLTYQASRATDRLDGIELDVVFRPPAFRPLGGCTTEAPGCALVNVAPLAGDTATRFAAQGTVYAPTAALDISMNGLKDQVLTRGLVARTIRLGLKADPGYKRPVMGVPPEPVKFTAYPDVTARASTFTPNNGFTINDPVNTRVIGEKPTPLTVDAPLTSAGPTSASIVLGGYTQDAPPLPAGAPIDTAVLRVAHREDDGIETVAVEVAFTGIDLVKCPQPAMLPRYLSPAGPNPPIGEDQIDLTACGFTLDKLANLTVKYTVTVPASPATVTATAYLDGITVDLLSGPLLRARVAFDATRDSVDVQGWSVLR